MLPYTMKLFTIRHVFGPTGDTIRIVRIAAKNEHGARSVFGRRYFVGRNDFLYVTECDE